MGTGMFVTSELLVQAQLEYPAVVGRMERRGQKSAVQGSAVLQAVGAPWTSR